jgi:hypothetical protein
MSNLINKGYLGKELQTEMQDFFSENVFLQLTQFMQEEHDLFKKALFDSKHFKKIYNPVIESKEVLDLTQEFNIDVIKYIEFFRSKEFIHFLEEIVDFSLQIKNLKIVKYSHKDFVLLSDLKKENDDVLEVFFDISDDWNEKYGGTQTYTTKEEEILHLEPQYNTLTILYKPEEVMKYLKYINHRAEKKEIVRVEIQFEIIEVEN